MSKQCQERNLQNLKSIVKRRLGVGIVRGTSRGQVLGSKLEGEVDPQLCAPQFPSASTLLPRPLMDF